MKRPAFALLALSLLAGCAASDVASSAIEPTTPPTTVPVTPTPAVTTWYFCANENGGCAFAGSGLREARFTLNGVTTTKLFYGGLESCSAAQFGLATGGSGAARCDYASVYKTRQLVNPTPNVNGLAATVSVPLGHEGYTTQRIAPTTDLGAVSDIGAFRNPCDPTHFAFDDPIVAPGQPGASHLHMFFGNTTTDANSTASSIATSGASSCAGGTANRTAYWVPALIDGTGTPVLPDGQLFYYKTGYLGVTSASVQSMPAGLRMVSGDKNATGPQSNASWGCWEVYIGHLATIREVVANGQCGAGKHVVMIVAFPQCWDGVNLDAPDHNSHMAFGTGRGCPATHPVALPEITFNIKFLIPPSGAQEWRLTSDNYDYRTLGGGMSVHGDWYNGWDTAVERTWITNCVNKSKDCHAFLLGDGRMLF